MKVELSEADQTHILMFLNRLKSDGYYSREDDAEFLEILEGLMRKMVGASPMIRDLILGDDSGK